MSESKGVEEIFMQVMDLPAEEQAQALATLCPDPERRRAVQELLDWDAKVPEPFLGGKQVPPSQIENGARIGPYHITGRLGEGGMGTVYSARQAFPDREVALKVLRAGRITADTTRRFRQEIEVLGRLQHIGIARIYDAGVHEMGDAHGIAQEVPYFTMELVRGLPLLQYARERGLDQGSRIELLARVCDAVHYAHLRAVIHRDLKSENVLVTREESTAAVNLNDESGEIIGQPKVLDFGIARVMDPDTTRLTRQTRAGSLVGTLSNMSPEQVSGDGQLVDVRTDVYALGVMLYELLCGCAPLSLEGLSLAQAVQCILDESPANPGERDRSLRGDVTTIVLKALEKEPDRRYQSAMELAADLRNFLRGSPVLARGDSRLYLMRRSMKRHRQAVGVVLFLAVVLGAFAVTRSRQAQASEVLAASEAQARKQAEGDFERAVIAVDLLTELGGRGFAGGQSENSSREELLQAALEFHRGLLSAHPDDPALRQRRGLTYLRIADLEVELGKFEEALTDVDLAIESITSVSLSPDQWDLEIATGLADAKAVRGKLIAKLGNPEEALTVLQESVDAYRQIWQEHELPDSDLEHTRIEQASALKVIAKSLRDSGRGEESISALAEAQQLLATTLRESPSNALRQELMRVLQEFWSLRFERGEMEDAEAALSQAIELGAELDAEFGGDPSHVLSLMGLRSNYSVQLSGLNREQDACDLLDLVIASGAPIAEAHPEIAEIRQTLFSAHSNRGTGRMKLGDNSGAADDFQRASEYLSALIEEQPSPERIGKLAVLQCNQGGLLISLGRHADATLTLTESVANAEQAMIALPSAPNLRSVHQFSRVNLALCRIVLGEYEEGMQVVQSITYRQDGYLNPVNIMAVLGLYEVGVELALGDEFLEEEERDVRAEEYAKGAAAYMQSGLTDHGKLLLDLINQRDWGMLGEFPEFAEVLGAAR